MLYTDVLLEIEKSCKYLREHIDLLAELKTVQANGTYSRSDLTSEHKYQLLFQERNIRFDSFNVVAEVEAVISIVEEKAESFILNQSGDTDKLIVFFRIVHFIWFKYVESGSDALSEQHLKLFFKHFDSKYLLPKGAGMGIYVVGRSS